VRHAEPEESSVGRCYGSLDVALSPRGREQAARLGAALAGVDLAAVYASPRRRAVATATAVAEPHGLAVAPLDGLRELDFGELEGRTYAEIERERPELFRQWMDAPTTVEFPGGESYPRLRARVLAAFDELRESHPGTTVAAVAHGGSIRAALAGWLAIPDDAIFRLGLDYAGVSIVEWLGDTPVVRLVNGREPALAL
jgi:broad specificity phosphatase PhoE